MMIKKEKSNIIFVIIAFFIGIIGTIFVFYRFPVLVTSNITRVEKNVTISDTGIAESVEKVYDSVVIVSTYKSDYLYATGTGFVYKVDDKFAYILTNNHVIESGDKINVTLTNGNVYETSVVGSDELSDIAVLTIDKKNIISVADLGNSNDVRVGDTAFAVGAPLDNVYSWTVTRGIISGKDRMVEVKLNTGDYVMKAIQTDAAINSGNSGGPLCNANGEVIGITSLKLVDESVEGMGFAIPIEVALSFAKKMEQGKTIVVPYLGVSMLNVSEGYYYSQYSKLINQSGVSSGVIIVDVEKGSSAYNSGLQLGDIITKVGDIQVANIAYLKYYLYSYNIGDTIHLTIIRNGKEKIIKVKLTSKNTF